MLTVRQLVSVIVTVGSLAGPNHAWGANPVVAPPPETDPLPPGAVLRIGWNRLRDQNPRKRVFFSKDGKSLITTNNRDEVLWWDPSSGRLLHRLPFPAIHADHSDLSHATGLLAVLGLAQSDTSRPSPAIWLVDVVERKVVRTLAPTTRAGGAGKVAFTPNGKRLIAAVGDQISVWDPATGDELLRLKVAAGGGVFALSPDGKTVAFGMTDLFLWRWEQGEAPKSFASFRITRPETTAFIPDGKSLWVQPAGQGKFQVFDLATGQPTRTVDVGGWSRGVALSPDGATLAVGYMRTSAKRERSHCVALWDVASGREIGRLPVGTSEAYHVSWSQDGTRLAAGTDSQFWAWDVRTRVSLTPMPAGHEGPINGMALGPDGRFWTSSDDRTIRSWDAAGTPGLVLSHDHWVRGLALSPDGALVAGSALNNDLRVWDAKSGAQRFRLLGNGDMGGRREVRFTPDGAKLVAWGDDDYLRTFDMRTGKAVSEHLIGEPPPKNDNAMQRLIRQEIREMSVGRMSPDTRLFALSDEKKTEVFDTATGARTATLRAGMSISNGLAFSADGKLFAVAGHATSTRTPLPDGSVGIVWGSTHPISVWDVAGESEVWSSAADGRMSAHVAFSLDGSRVASTRAGLEKQGLVQVWDGATGKAVGQIALPVPGRKLLFDRDGKRLAVALEDMTVLIYDVAAALTPAPGR